MKSSALKILALLLLLMKAGPAFAQETFVPSVQWNGLLQYWNEAQAGQWNETLHYLRLKVTALVDPETKMVVMPVLGTNTDLTLLDAFVQRDMKNDWTVTAGQFKFAFGDDRALFPDQLKRVAYAQMDHFVFPGSPWDMGFKVKKLLGEFTMAADLIQGNGPNVLTDNNNIKDVSTRLEWKSGNVLLGGSYYGGTGNATGFTTYQNWFGLHARYAEGAFDSRVETVWAPISKNAYLAQVSYKLTDLEPVIWGELGLVGSAQNYQILGLGFNWWPAEKTRISLNFSLNGATDFSAPALWILQIEQVF